MDQDFLNRYLLVSLAVNYTFLFTWFLAFVFAREFMRKVHGRWFQLSDATFDAIHYGAMAAYKLAIFFFNLVPLVALYVTRGGS